MSDAPAPAFPESPIHEPPAEASSAPQPWGFWATVGFSAILIAIYVAVEMVLLFGLMVLGGAPVPSAGAPSARDLRERIESVSTSGTFISLETIIAGVLVPVCCALFAMLRKGLSVREYLALRSVPTRRLLLWIALSLILAAALDSMTWGLEREIIPDFMVNAYETVAIVPLLWIGVIIGAPLAEEFFFRGFVLTGLRNSWLGTHGAVLVTAAIWAAIHMQYDLFGITSIFLVGLVLGYARVRTQSLYVPIAMHAIHNLVATAEVALYLRYWQP